MKIGVTSHLLLFYLCLFQFVIEHRGKKLIYNEAASPFYFTEE